MDEIVEEIVTSTGADRTTVAHAIGIILAFIAKEAPPDKVRPLFDGIPGAETLAATSTASPGGLFGVFNDLSASGLGLAEIQSVVMAFVGAAKKKVGERPVDDLVGAIPGLGQFI